MEGNSFKNYNKPYLIKFYFHRYITVIESQINCYKLFHAKITSTFFTRSPHYRHAKFSSHNPSISSVEWLTLINLLNSWFSPSSETQEHLVVAGKRLNGRAKESGEEKSRKKVGVPRTLLLTDQFRNHLKSLPVIGHKNIFCAHSESSSFRVTLVTSYSNMFTAKHFARLIAILIFPCSCRRVSLDRKVPLKREP